MRSIILSLLIIASLIIITRGAFACDQDAICRHILWCLTDPTIDPNDRNNLNWSIDVGSGTNVRFNTEKCQKSRATRDGYDHWHADEQACGDDTLIGMARLARANQCRPNPPPSPPTPPAPPGPQGNTCDAGDQIFCYTTVPKGRVCYCRGREGISK